MSKTDLTRRTFLKATGAVGAAAAVGVGACAVAPQASGAVGQALADEGSDERIVWSHCHVNCGGACVLRFHMVGDTIKYVESDNTGSAESHNYSGNEPEDERHEAGSSASLIKDVLRDLLEGSVVHTETVEEGTDQHVEEDVGRENTHYIPGSELEEDRSYQECHGKGYDTDVGLEHLTDNYRENYRDYEYQYVHNSSFENKDDDNKITGTLIINFEVTLMSTN